MASPADRAVTLVVERGFTVDMAIERIRKETMAVLDPRQIRKMVKWKLKKTSEAQEKSDMSRASHLMILEGLRRRAIQTALGDIDSNDDSGVIDKEAARLAVSITDSMVAIQGLKGPSQHNVAVAVAAVDWDRAITNIVQQAERNEQADERLASVRQAFGLPEETFDIPSATIELEPVEMGDGEMGEGSDVTD